MSRVMFTSEADRAQKRVAALVPDTVAKLITGKAAQNALSVSETAEWFLRVRFEERVRLYTLEREHGVPTPLPPAYPRARMRLMKLKVSDSDLRRLLRLTDIEFEPLRIAVGRVLMLGAERLCGRPYVLWPENDWAEVELTPGAWTTQCRRRRLSANNVISIGTHWYDGSKPTVRPRASPSHDPANRLMSLANRFHHQAN